MEPSETSPAQPPGRLEAWKKLKSLHPRPLDLGRLALIEARSRAELADPAQLAALIPELGLNDEAIEEIPAHLHPWCGQGLRIWQYPNQFGRYLADLAGRRISSYLEIGVRHGGTFVATVEILGRFHPLDRAVGVDVIPCPSLVEYGRRNPRAEFLCANTQSPEFARRLDERGRFDLVLIDSLHEERQCRAEFETVRERAAIVAFHDIASVRYPGVAKVWSEVRAAGEHDCVEFTDQYESVGASYMGLGVAVRKDRA
ncbi:MAG TPA: class I SAM-dependent methyltransferase [Thermoanaerobaculia bacterium]|jgi:hypothetical protein